MSTPSAGFDSLGIDLDSVPEKLIRAVRIGLGLASAVALIIGVALLVWPGRTLMVGGALIGINLLITGLVRTAIGVFGSAYSAGMRVLSIVLGLLVILGGIVLLRNLAAGTAILVLIMTIVVGIGWIIDGVMALVDSDKASSRGWAIALGIISILAGIAVVAAPAWSATFFFTFVAIILIVLGIVGLVRAFRFGSGRSTVIDA
ncbi:DUF308 domain-containing protein [Demequina sp. SYSU T00039]|uniref:DUF308 domain-containing protein n=1 Tax=Demequina lignilytica TaxID=3051663 RepID=A0AAW7M0Y8_9MICO|nr:MULTISPECIES: DUF308 domain-containing protein [unclassified Demequina]MDN4477566.1 DUF308 domain-containing protein [Demequina sp. SYSU T00039-1]MDN4488083.1 DUF308 domain-containing protein [Demequina sp. SYSU T00039]MDN4490524.1 DUF308 domain-containing protein [Demequina sp. SYSU T00068]